MDIYTILKFSAITSLLHLDNKNIVSIGISRPIITGAILGILFNNIFYGIFIGCIIELILINLLPIGAFIPPNGTIITGIAMIISYDFHIYKNGSLLPIVLIYSIFWGHIAKRISRLLWKRNTFLVELFLKNVQKDKFHFAPYNWIVLFSDFLIYLLVTFVGGYLGILIMRKFVQIFLTSYFIHLTLDKALYYLPLFVLIYILNSFDLPKKGYFIASGMALALLLNLLSLNPLFIIILIGFFSYILIFSIQYYKEHYYEL